MEEMIKNTQDVAVSASPWQDIAQVEGNKVPSPDKNESIGTQGWTRDKKGGMSDEEK